MLLRFPLPHETARCCSEASNERTPCRTVQDSEISAVRNYNIHEESETATYIIKGLRWPEKSAGNAPSLCAAAQPCAPLCHCHQVRIFFAVSLFIVGREDKEGQDPRERAGEGGRHPDDPHQAHRAGGRAGVRDASQVRVLQRRGKHQGLRAGCTTMMSLPQFVVDVTFVVFRVRFCLCIEKRYVSYDSVAVRVRVFHLSYLPHVILARFQSQPGTAFVSGTIQQYR